MWKIEQEVDNVDRIMLMNVLYAFYEGRATAGNALDLFEADLERLSVVYEELDMARLIAENRQEALRRSA